MNPTHCSTEKVLSQMPTDPTENPEAAFPRFSLLDVRLTATRIEHAVRRIVMLAKRPDVHRHICIFAVDSLLRAHGNARLSEIANASDMTLCDGMPLVLIGRHIAKQDMSRCYGPDVMLQVCDKGRAVGVKHFLYGGANQEVLEKLKANLIAKFPGLEIVGDYCPPFRPLTEEEHADVVARINGSGADIVWVGIGTPKQDYWVTDMREALKPSLLIAVGAAFNFHAGTVKQAPLWMRRNCLEWLYRLLAEPRRLWRRYILGNPHFLFLLLRQVLTRKPARLGEMFDGHASDSSSKQA